MSAVTLRDQLEDLFIDPISHQRMKDPMKCNPCGHTYEKVQIEGVRKYAKRNDMKFKCPLCDSPVQTLVHNILFKRTLEILDNNNLEVSIDNLSNFDKHQVERVVNMIREKRARDAAERIPDRLSMPENFDRGVMGKCRDKNEECFTSCFEKTDDCIGGVEDCIKNAAGKRV